MKSQGLAHAGIVAAGQGRTTGVTRLPCDGRCCNGSLSPQACRGRVGLRGLRNYREIVNPSFILLPSGEKEVLRRPQTAIGPYGAIQVAFRAGMNPAGIRATSFIDLISTAETLLVCSFAT
jgi:hypothetical protein